MPLYDHFRPPISREHEWVSFHHAWSGSLMDYLNERLPSRFLAEIHVQVGRAAEADVIEYDRVSPTIELTNNGHGFSSSDGGGIALAAEPAVYAPPEVTATFEVEFDDA